MFIGVINENFTVAESEKRQKQLEAYLQRNEKKTENTRQRLFKKFSPYGRRWAKFEAELEAERRLDYGLPAPAPVISKGSVWKRSVDRASSTVKTITSTLFGRSHKEESRGDQVRTHPARKSSYAAGDLLDAQGRPQSVLDLDLGDFQPLQQGRHSRDTTTLLDGRTRMLRARSELGLHQFEGPTQEAIDAEHIARSRNDPRRDMARFMAKYPNYDKSLWIFSNSSRIRRFCQSIVPPPRGARMFGRPVSPIRFRIYQGLLFLSIIASVTIAGVATPAYRKWYDLTYSGKAELSWYSFADSLLALLFLVELVIKIIADGFAFTPHAYLLSGWNMLDLFVLLTLFVNIFAGDNQVARAARAFRALRLINLSGLMRQTFHIMFTAGLPRMLDAGMLAVLYIIPFAVWGQNLFAGLLYSCTDGSPSILTRGDCYGEYQASPVSDWTFYAPRSWQNPTEGSKYSFDTFSSSLLILFEIVSLEGWINVMSTAMSIAGKDQQLQPDNQQYNAIFFVLYNLIGAIIVLTLFVSVIIENFRTFSGAAFLTTEQRQWIDLKRLIVRQKPSRRPADRPTSGLRLWCYERAIRKTSWWSRTMTILYIVNTIVLMTATYDDPPWKDFVRCELAMNCLEI